MIDKRLAEWLVGRDTGSSSKAIMLWLSAGVKDETWGASTPSDPSDLGRCLRLLERIPEWKPRIGEMAEAGGEWPTYVEYWQKMADSMEAEVGIHWEKGQSAPKTYALMKAVQDKARQAANTAEQYVKLSDTAEVRFHPIREEER